MELHDLLEWLGSGAPGLDDPGHVIDLLTQQGVDLASLSDADLAALADHLMPETAAAAIPQAAALPGAAVHFGGMHLLNAIADCQGLKPICATETLENVFQILIGDIGGSWNGLSDHLQQVAAAHGWGAFEGGGLVLFPEHYADVLAYLGVPSHWYEFSADLARAALDGGRPVAAFVDAAWLGYPGPGAHAITLTDVTQDAWGRVAGFVGIDSNFPGEERVWGLDQIAGGVRSLQETCGAWWAGRILIPDVASRWPFLT